MISIFVALQINPLLQYAIITGLAGSLVSGIMGSLVVIKRLAFISGGIAHSILGGVGLSVWLSYKGILDITPLTGALIAGIIAAVLLGWIHLFYQQREDAIIAVLWSIGMSIGVIFLAITPGANMEIGNYLIGNILWVNARDIITIIILDVIVLLVVLTNYNRLLLLCFDEKQASLQNIRVHLLYFLFLILTAVTVVLLIQIVGIILVITMLIIPATMSNHFTFSLPKMMIASILITMIMFFVGITVSYYLNVPTGATIALITGISYILSLVLKGAIAKN